MRQVYELAARHVIRAFHHGSDSHPHEKRDIYHGANSVRQNLRVASPTGRLVFKQWSKLVDRMATWCVYAWTRFPSSRWKNCDEETIVRIMDRDTCKITVRPRTTAKIALKSCIHEINPRDWMTWLVSAIKHYSCNCQQSVNFQWKVKWMEKNNVRYCYG